MIEVKEPSLSEASELKKIIKLCESVDFPTAVFDSSLKCVYSKKGLITIDSKASQYLTEGEWIENSSFTSTVFMVKDIQYCTKIIRIGEFYVCGLFNSRELQNMAKYTDFFEKLAPIIDVFQYNLVHLWEIMAKLKNSEESKLAASMEQYLVKMNQITQKLFEYIPILLKNSKIIRVDCCELLSTMINRCNTFLAKCGRHIDFIKDESESCYISADKRLTLCAFINAIQNSLLYSPKDSVPLVSVYKQASGKKKRVVVKIVNINSYYTELNKDLYENSFANHKIGLGIPIMKYLTEETGGEFSFENINGKVTVTMSIPALEEYESEMPFFECDDYTHYDTGIPDLLEFMMREVVDLFEEDAFS